MGNRVVVVAAVAAVLLGGCRARNPDIGRACSVEEPCPAAMFCIPDHDGADVCMEECPSDGTTCGNGSLCLDTTMGERVCWIGGPVGIGGVCDSHLDCTRGGLCVLIDGETDATCFRACTVGRDNDCEEGERCEPTSTSANGFCVGPI